ncbi:SapC [Rhodospirillum rubrum]|uniref:SapC family protein n=1 Tax=Rhodospirillum rubrum TaxID=1085 RepID=UPI0019030DE1|nr:SapC family protein [Rhodospirillum rubrum]MBK1664077.1 SapC [Rhodospirillum rubrum]MBK1676050.1 SapC [Rhodospirillum rubrum]
MFKTIHPLSVARHGKLRLKPVSDYRFAAQEAVIGLVGAEIHKAIHAFPIAFLRSAHAGGTSCQMVGLLSVTPGQNLLVSPDGRWLGDYIPAALRAYPFVLARSQEDADTRLPCLDEDCGLLSESEGQPLFSEDGQLSDFSRRIIDFLTATERNREATQKGVDVLEKAQLFTPWSLQVVIQKQTKAIEGFHVIDETKLNQLDDETWLALRRAGVLPLIYGHLLSLNRTDLLGQLSGLQAQLAQQLTARPKLDDMLDFGDESILQF